MSTTEKCACGASAAGVSFDRSICACGSMHYYCDACGAQDDDCFDSAWNTEPAIAGDSKVEAASRFRRFPGSFRIWVRAGRWRGYP